VTDTQRADEYCDDSLEELEELEHDRLEAVIAHLQAELERANERLRAAYRCQAGAPAADDDIEF
jgi:hypothetical protein